jgi:hypothetical protein
LDEEDLIETAGHPERFVTRWRLVGTGLSNVWRYGDLRLDAPSGRLLLRGPNGTGKTTALEALWPYLLDLNAQRLAAGKARPTSLALLMREGTNGAKRRCGYLWLTLAAPNNEGVCSYGVRLLYAKGGSPEVKVTLFMVPGVPLRDVPLYGSGRGFLSAEQFSDTITAAGGTVFPDEESYVAHLGTRIWATTDRDLVELANRIRAVRNPTLLGDVSPRAAADTLRDALPGVSDDVVSATAEALAESDATREAFQRDRDAAVALDRFAAAWAGHVVEVVSQAHVAVRSAMSEADKAEKGPPQGRYEFGGGPGRAHPCRGRTRGAQGTSRRTRRQAACLGAVGGVQDCGPSCRPAGTGRSGEARRDGRSLGVSGDGGGRQGSGSGTAGNCR